MFFTTVAKVLNILFPSCLFIDNFVLDVKDCKYYMPFLLHNLFLSGIFVTSTLQIKKQYN